MIVSRSHRQSYFVHVVECNYIHGLYFYHDKIFIFGIGFGVCDFMRGSKSKLPFMDRETLKIKKK